MKQTKTLVILISLFILALIAIPYSFSADIDNINNLDNNPLTTEISQINNNILSMELAEEKNIITAEPEINSFYDNSSAQTSLNEKTSYEDKEIRNSNHSKLSAGEDNPNDSNHIYFDASLPNDNGDGSAQNPYKYFNASKLIANHTIHLANGKYLIDGGSSLKNLTIIGSDNTKTILKYKHLNYDVFTTSNFINLTLSSLRLTNGGKITAINCIFKGASPRPISSGSNKAFEVNLKNCTFIKNNGEDGGAISMQGGKLYMEDCFFINNTATQYGGAIYLTNMNQTIIKNTQIIGSKSNDGVGGGIFISLSQFNATNLEIINSSAKFGAGMGILNSNITLNSIKLINNTAKYEGGAIYQMYGNFSLNNSIIENNSALNGGGLFIDNATNAYVGNTDFIRNIASMTGGAVYSFMNNRSNIDYSNNTETGNTFNDNQAISYNDIFEANQINLNIISENYSMYKVNDTEIIELPSYYSLVDEGYVSSVKNQGIGGNCWAFSAIAVLESCILKAGGDIYDFSENNMKNLMSLYSDYGWRMKPNKGGYDAMAMAYLSSWLGPVLEIEDPYNDEDMVSPLLNGSVHVQNILFLESKDGQDTEEIKKALMKYGAVATGLYYKDSYLKGTAYYYNGTESSDHGVTIVGWDDNYSASNFNIAPPGDGAWIVKNSWGPYWGDNGYFYVSYYDKVIGRKEEKKETFTIILNDTIKLEKNYQYDIGKNRYMHNNYSTVWYKNNFIADGDELLAAVSTYFEKNTDWEVSIIVNGENRHTQTGSALPGYFTFNLNNFISLEKGDVFEVVFKITVDEAAAIPILTPGNQINKKTFDKNMSFLSYDGKSWEDISLFRVNIWTAGNKTHAANFISQVACIKAFTIINPLETVTSLDIISSGFNSVKLVSSVKDIYNNTIKTGNILFNINGKEIMAEIINGTAELLYDLDKLTTNITASFIDNHHINSSNNTIISIPPINVDLDIKISTEMDSANISINASKEINAPLKILVNEKEYNIDLINGKGHLNLDKLEVGNYTVIGKIENEIFNCKKNAQFNIDLIQTRILGNNLTTDDFSSVTYEITLLDKIGQGISNKTIDVLIKEINNASNSFRFSPTTDNEGKAEILINLKGGSYTINLKFNEDNKYASAEENYSLKVKDKISLNIETKQNINNLEITIKANKSINETIKLHINSQEYQLQLTNGQTSKKLNNLENRNYTIKAELTNTQEYITNTQEKTVEINIKTMQIIAEDMEIVSNSNVNYYIKLTDQNNKPINNKTITITLNNQTYTKTTDSKGQASLAINLPKGTYTINISFPGDNQYYNASANKTIKVKEPITLNIETKQNINNLEITIKANKSINETIKLHINNQTYTIQLNNGEITKQLNNLENGNYTIKAELTNTEEYITNTQQKTVEINIKHMQIIAEDMETASNSNINYPIKLTDENNNPIKNKTITIRLNNQTYTKTTDSKGEASLAINLPKGTYTINISFPGDNQYYNASTNKTIKVKEPITLTIETKQNINNLEITIKANKTINETIKLHINNQEYQLQLTNGQTNKQLNNLQNGNYTIYSEIINTEDYITNTQEKTVEINIKTMQIIAENMETSSNSNENYQIKLIDENNKPIINKTITITLNKQKYTKTTDNKGQTSIPINLPKGTYTINISFPGDNQYYNASTNKTIIVKEPITLSIETKQNINNLEITIKANKSINETIKLHINNQEYQLQLTNGQTNKQLNNLQNGNYTIKTELTNTQDYITNTQEKTVEININPVNIIANDLETTTNSNVNYNIIIYDCNNKAFAEKTVIITLNNQTYTKTTNKDGQTSLAINLAKGTYTITITTLNDNEHASTSLNKTIKVKEPITLNTETKQNINNLEITIKANKTINETIKLHINEQTYTIQLTNGQANKQLNNLQNGNYTIKAELTNTQDYITNTQEKTVEINLGKPIIISENMETIEGSSRLYMVTIFNNNYHTLSNKTVIITLNNQTYTKTTDEYGHIYLEINFPKGTYTINIRTLEDNEYLSSSATNTIKVKGVINLDISLSQKMNSLNVTVKSDKKINETLTLKMNNENYTLELKNGEGLKEFKNLENGNYTFSANINNPEDDIVNIKTAQIEINLNKINIIANDLETTENSDEQYIIALKDKNNRAISNKEITINLNNQTYIKTTNSQGETSIPINLGVGTYTINISFKGDNNYYSAEENRTIKVKENITINGDLSKKLNNITLDINLSKSINETLNIILSNKNTSTEKKYNITTKEGKASLKISDLENGDYEIRVLIANESRYDSNIFECDFNINVIGTKIIAENQFFKEYLNESHQILLVDENDNPIANKEITIRFNGSTFQKTTDNKGLIYQNINLKEGIYQMDIKFNGDDKYLKSEKSINITVIKERISLKIDISTDLDVAKINIKADKNINDTIELSINNTKYSVRFVDGIGALELNELEDGKYIVTVKNDKLGISQSKEFEIVNEYMIIADDFTCYNNSNSIYTIQFVNGKKPMANKTIQFNLDGKTISKTTDNNGKTSISINLNVGVYDIVIRNPDVGIDSRKKIDVISLNDTIKRQHTKVIVNDMITTAITKTIDRNGEWFVFKLVDENGNIIKNKPICVGFNGKVYNKTTDENGEAKLQINLIKVFTYTFAVAFLGDDEYYASFDVAKITVNPQKASLSVPLNTYKLNAKTKQITATFKDSRGIAVKGKKISFTVNGKTYMAKTNSNGIASVKVSLNKKGTYKVISKFEGDKTFSKITKTSFIIVI